MSSTGFTVVVHTRSTEMSPKGLKKKQVKNWGYKPHPTRIWDVLGC